MMKLDNFVGMMTGHFDNKDQFKKMQAEGKTYPYAEHVNTICNDKINNLPEDFKGKFVVEESYYEINGKRHASPHLFLITEIEQGILLSSYEIPKGEDKNTFSYDSMKNVDYSKLVLHPASSQTITGYSLANLVRASCVLNCQLIFTLSALRLTVHIRTCCLKLSKSGHGFPNAWRLMIPISISAMSSQLPCFGV